MNKVLCFAECNRQKGDRLPVEWLGRDSEEFEKLTQRAKKLPFPKYQRLVRSEIPAEWANRDFTDTAYMTKVARYYLSYLVDEPHKVFCSKGSHTALLRKHWELNSLLRDDDQDLKNRDDHRHHALDAVTIALIDRRALQKLNDTLKFESRFKDSTDPEDEGRKIYRLKPYFEKPDLPWPTFRLDLAQTLDHIWVSHRPNRKISGPLHQETNYGPTGEDGILVRRKSVSTLTDGELSRIRDPEVRRIIENYLQGEPRLYREDFGNKIPEELAAVLDDKGWLNVDDIRNAMDAREAKSWLNKLQKKNQLLDAEHGRIRHPKSGIPIKKVRLTKKDQTAIPLRPSKPGEYVIPGNTHHLVIFSLGDGKHLFIPVTMLEAARRLKNRETVIRTTPPEGYPEAEFLFHLCPGDSMVATIDGKEELFVFKTMATSTLQTKFIKHIDARSSTEVKQDGKVAQDAYKLYTCYPSSFSKNFPNACKVEVSPTGEIRNI